MRGLTHLTRQATSRHHRRPRSCSKVIYFASSHLNCSSEPIWTAADAKADQKLRRILRTEPPVHITPDPPKSILRIGRPKDHGKKGLHFDEIVEVLPTLGPKEYSRKPDPNSTFRNLTPMLRNEIRDEVNQYKSAEMEIHPESVDNLCFH